LYFQCAGDAALGDQVHLARADLDLERLPVSLITVVCSDW
jgi:hypothetical protein